MTSLDYKIVTKTEEGGEGGREGGRRGGGGGEGGGGGKGRGREEGGEGGGGREGGGRGRGGGGRGRGERGEGERGKRVGGVVCMCLNPSNYNLLAVAYEAVDDERKEARWVEMGRKKGGGWR